MTYRHQDNYRYVGGDLVRTCREDELWTGEQPVFEGNIPLIGSTTPVLTVTAVAVSKE